MRETETQSGFFSSNYTKYSRIVGIHLILDWNFAETLLALQQQQQQLMTVYNNMNRNCEAQGKGRAKGRPRKVTQRSFIDGGWWMVDILSLMLYIKFG